MKKSLIAVEPLVASPREKKLKYCSTCDQLATLEAHFDVDDGIIIIEKYCVACSKHLGTRSKR